MRDVEKTVGTMIDKQKTAFIGSIDSEGFPNIKAMLQPRKREGDRKSTRLNSSHTQKSRMPSSA